MSPLVLALLACGGDPPAERQPLPSDTGTADVFTIDTGDFLPVDTGITTGTEDDVPTNLLTVSQSGTWSLSPLGGPFTELAGTLVIEEFVDELGPRGTPCAPRTPELGSAVRSPTCPARCSFRSTSTLPLI